MDSFTEFYRLRAFARKADGVFSYLWYGQRRTLIDAADCMVRDCRASDFYMGLVPNNTD
jgi:hypothetical protein